MSLFFLYDGGGNIYFPSFSSYFLFSFIVFYSLVFLLFSLVSSILFCF